MHSGSSPFSILISQPSKPRQAAMATSAAAAASAASRLPNRRRQCAAPASHSVISVPSTGTPWVWAALTQPGGGTVTRWWLKYTNASRQRQWRRW